MQPVHQALDDVKALYLKVLGQPAPEIQPGSFASFPPGVDPLDHAVREVEQLKRFSDQIGCLPGRAAWIPPADIFVSDDTYIVKLEIPGVDRDSIKVLVVGGECVVRGERSQKGITPDMHPLAVERPSGEFERRFMLPAGSRYDAVKAKYADGVLELRIAFDGIDSPEEKNVEVV